jgi:pre-mRNA-splicing factor CWC26
MIRCLVMAAAIARSPQRTVHNISPIHTPTMSLSDYLAKNYLTADSDKKSKKRKRKEKNGGLKIADDDISGWNNGGSDDDEDGPTIGTITRFIMNINDHTNVISAAGMTLSSTKSKKKKSKPTTTSTASWKTVGVAAPSHAQQLAADQAAIDADAIIASTVADRQDAADAEDEAPEMVDTEGVFLESGARAGLQTAAQVAADLKRKNHADKKKAAEVAKEGGVGETIYRDASGRIINVAMKRAEARKKAEEEERKKLEAERAARGDVQNAEATKRREQLQNAKGLTIARYADDAELNDELKEQGRWNDPAAGFLRKKKAGRSITGKPLYQGAFQPNRYGIRPGHRWDGVDRANGFESEWFKSRNKKANVEKMEYAWQMDE